jgi:Ni/Fe-hydrogenase 1 B-type cytochrome subunit
MASAQSATYHRTYVWEFPVRLYHWVNAACIVSLVVTGYLIGSPLTISYAQEAYQQYWFGAVRFLVRIYWGFVGNRFARWRNFLPLSGTQWREVAEVIKVDVLQTSPRGLHALGHNALAGLIYFLSFLVFLFQAATGFALYSAMSNSVLPRLFSWVVPFMGGDFVVRQWHHASMWFFVVFTIIHVYLVAYHDYIEGRGTTSSMVGGWKFEREDEHR